MDKKKKFIDKANLTHGDRYDYSLVKYQTNKTKVKIVCKEHGIFEQTPDKHINKQQGCPNCRGNKKLTTVEFIKKSKEKHGDKYDYSLTEYVNANTNVTIKCKEHGAFQQVPKLHMSGSNCPMCFGRNKNNNYVVESLKLVHGDRYDYSLVKYVSEKHPIKILCDTHGEFEQTYNTHKKGHGCPKCVGRDKTTDDFIKEANIIHNNKYSYGYTIYSNSISKVRISCPVHGIFTQSPSNHLQGNGCPKCKSLAITNKKTKTTDEFISEAKLVHSDRYDYTSVTYLGCKDYIDICCKEHGLFTQTPDSHLQGNGCPKCGLSFDKTEGEVKEFIKSLDLDFIENTRKIIPPLELDIYIASHKLAIEFDGLYWHSELYKPNNYHLNKTDLCESNGIQLIHIFEDEWLLKRDIVESRIRNILGLTTDKIYGRKTIVKEILNIDSNSFLSKNHLQGGTNASIRLGLYYNNVLVSVMTFNKPRLGIGTSYDGYELTRFANKLNTSVIGGADKLLSYFIKRYKPNLIVSYADRRWSQGGLYEKLNFIENNKNEPNYWYIIGNVRKHRFGFRKHKLKDEGFDTINKTEHQIMLDRKIYRIYDCGTITYKKTIS